jgi:hypothetical protein
MVYYLRIFGQIQNSIEKFLLSVYLPLKPQYISRQFSCTPSAYVPFHMMVVVVAAAVAVVVVVVVMVDPYN